MQHEFQRVAIVNRGEAAMRFIHAAREFNQEHGTALRTIALFTEPDAHAMFVREADEAVLLGRGVQCIRDGETWNVGIHRRLEFPTCRGVRGVERGVAEVQAAGVIHRVFESFVREGESLLRVGHGGKDE